MSSVSLGPCNDVMGDYACNDGSYEYMMTDITEAMLIAMIMGNTEMRATIPKVNMKKIVLIDLVMKMVR